MHLIRRSAFRAASSSPSSFLSSSRSITTSTPFVLRSKAQSSVSSSVFRRFNSNDAQEKSNAPESADGERGAVREAINSASESVRETGEYVNDAVADAAAGVASAFGAREPRQYEERRPRDNNSGYGDDRRGGPPSRGGYGGDRGSGGYNNERRFNNDRRGGPGGYDNRATRSGGFGGSPDRVITPSTGIYVGNLLFDITAKDIEKEFEAFGSIKSAIIAADARGLSKGFGYVEFETVEQAAAAIEAKHQTIMEGRRLVVNYMNKSTRTEGKENEPSKTLFIGNLAFEMSDADLNKLFRDIRNVIDVRVAIDRRTGQPRGFAHADFVDIESAIKGKEALVGKEVYGRKLRIDFSAGSRETRGDGGSQRSNF